MNSRDFQDFFAMIALAVLAFSIVVPIMIVARLNRIVAQAEETNKYLALMSYQLRLLVMEREKNERTTDR